MNKEIQDIYISILKEIRYRIIAIESLKIKDEHNFIFIELSSLQIRKILELIAYLSVIVNSEKLNHKNRNEWHAGKIINTLSEKTTIFYPLPSFMIPPEENDNINPILIPIGYKSALSQVEFVEAYNKCGKILHAQHPYQEEISLKDFLLYNKNITEKLKNLLSRHTIGIKQDENKYTFLHVEIDFTNKLNTKDSYIREYKTKIFSEDQLKKIFQIDIS